MTYKQNKGQKTQMQKKHLTNSTSLYDKSLKEPRNRRKIYLNIIKAKDNKPIANNTLNKGENESVFSKIRNEKRLSTFT
jgi:hypothetical protein